MCGEMRNLYAFALFATAIFTAACRDVANTTIVYYPYSRQILYSSKSEYYLYNINSDNEPHHRLIVTETKSGIFKMEYNYRRHVEVSWSNYGNFLFINDYMESNASECVLLNAKSGNIYHIREKLISMSVVKEEDLTGNSIIRCESWRADGGINVSVRLYGGRQVVDRKVVISNISDLE